MELAFCVECEDVAAIVKCQECSDAFCGLCFQWLHRRGKRQLHHAISLSTLELVNFQSPENVIEGTTDHFIKMIQEKIVSEKAMSSASLPSSTTTTTPPPPLKEEPLATEMEDDKDDNENMFLPGDGGRRRGAGQMTEEKDREEKEDKQEEGEEGEDEEDEEENEGDSGSIAAKRKKMFQTIIGRKGMSQEKSALLERIQFIPLRLTHEERVLLSIIECAMTVSEYTDRVDVSNSDYGFGFGFSYGFGASRNFGVNPTKKEETVRSELDEVFSIISGLFLASNYRLGKGVVERRFTENGDLFGRIFEVGRRFKVLNPEKMRTSYGKLIHILQDCTPKLTGFEAILPIATVGDSLLHTGALAFFEKDRIFNLLLKATMAIENQHGLSCHHIAALIKAKNTARSRLCTLLLAEPGFPLSAEQLSRLLDSITDSNTFLTQNRDPVDRIIELLQTFFDPSSFSDSSCSLEIRSGVGGSCLSHTHQIHYRFVMQSLQLWREIQHEMFRLWKMADADLLNFSNPYRLLNTGQGLNRVQTAPAISREMSKILSRVQTRMGGWVGLSVVHLGDRDVPNALVFIDKYTQVPRILAPIVKTIESIERLSKTDSKIHQLVEGMGGVSSLQRQILRDFFRHGFDGSGDDGGSCIDGRLTSAWNWCSKLQKKSYYHIFMLCGFEGFDGSFKQ